MDVIHLTERNEDAAAREVASLISRGGVVALPTDTVYGLCADIGWDVSVRKVFRIKARTQTKALPLFVRDVLQAKKYASIDEKLARLLNELWPGQTTVVLKKRYTVPNIVTGGDRTVGLRMPDHSFVAKVMALLERPVTGTSANLTGSEPAASGVEIQQVFRRQIPRPDLIVDAGTLPPSPASTVLDLTNTDNPKILRMGAITKQKLDEILKHWERPKKIKHESAA